MNPGTGGGGTATRVGANSRLVTGARVARHRRAGHRVVFAGMAWIAGHLAVDDLAFVGQHAGAARFGRAGARAIVASNTTVARAIIPRGPATGGPARFAGLHVVGPHWQAPWRNDALAVGMACRPPFAEEGTHSGRPVGAVRLYPDSGRGMAVASAWRLHGNRSAH